jgi:hypothetical protein
MSILSVLTDHSLYLGVGTSTNQLIDFELVHVFVFLNGLYISGILPLQS